MIRRASTSITDTAPHGPRALIGHSLGGLMATEIAARLTAQGREVIMVAVLDSVLPDLAVPATARPGRADGLATVGRGTGRGLWRSRTMVARVALGHRYPIGVHKQVHYELAARLVRSYQPVPYPGRSVLVSSHENTDQPQWWDPILPHRTAITLPCDHLGMLKPPYVRQTAELINDALQHEELDR